MSGSDSNNNILYKRGREIILYYKQAACAFTERLCGFRKRSRVRSVGKMQIIIIFYTAVPTLLGIFRYVIYYYYITVLGPIYII